MGIRLLGYFAGFYALGLLIYAKVKSLRLALENPQSKRSAASLENPAASECRFWGFSSKS